MYLGMRRETSFVVAVAQAGGDRDGVAGADQLHAEQLLLSKFSILA
jgi:hypothetical protein